jgi:hypothetical protein
MRSGTLLSTQSDYELSYDPYEIFSCNSQCRTDFGDVRFWKTNKSTALSYFLEDKTDSDTASFWVKMDYIYATGTNNYLYLSYGDPAKTTTTSSGTDTFTFFDHFDDSSIDTNKWYTATGTVSESGTLLTVGGSSGEHHLSAKTAYGSGYAFRSRAARNSTNLYGDYIAIAYGCWDSLHIMNYTEYKLKVREYIADAETISTINSVYKRSDNTYWISEIARDLSGATKYRFNNFLEKSSSSTFTNSSYIYLRTYDPSSASTMYYDWVAVRKSLPAEPTFYTYQSDYYLSPQIIMY